MPITKEALLKLGDSAVKDVQVGPDAEDTMRVRCITLRERNEILKDRPEGEKDVERNLLVTKRLICASLVDPKVTVEELDGLPAAIVDRLTDAVISHNGWGKEGKAAVADHFRAAS